MISKEKIISLFNKYQELNGICKNVSLFEGCDDDFKLDMDILEVGEKFISFEYFDGGMMHRLKYKYIGLGSLYISIKLPEGIDELSSIDRLNDVFLYVKKFFKLLSMSISDFFKMDILVYGYMSEPNSYTMHRANYLDEYTFNSNQNYIRIDDIKENRNELSSSRFKKNTISESDILRITNKVIKNL